MSVSVKKGYTFDAGLWASEHVLKYIVHFSQCCSARAFKVGEPKFLIDFIRGKACRGYCNYKNKFKYILMQLEIMLIGVRTFRNAFSGAFL